MGIDEPRAFSFDEFKFDEFREPIFEERETKAFDIGDILGSLAQRQAITGRDLSTAFISGVAEPALKGEAQEAKALTALEDIREREEREQAFGEYQTERTQAFGEYQFEKDLAFAQFKHEEDIRLEEEKLDLEKERLDSEEDSWCCFIFIEAYGGLLPIVRRYRDEHMTDRNRRGYYKLADKIVPFMKKSKLFKYMVKVFMTDPMVSYGKYYYGKGRVGLVFKPITKVWLNVFNWLGKNKPYTRKNGEVI